MRTFFAALALAGTIPAAASAQSAGTPGSAAADPAAGAGTYGPPAPAPAPPVASGSRDRATADAPQSPSQSSRAEHRRHRRGGYLEADGGITAPR